MATTSPLATELAGIRAEVLVVAPRLEALAERCVELTREAAAEMRLHDVEVVIDAGTGFGPWELFIEAHALRDSIRGLLGQARRVTE